MLSTVSAATYVRNYASGYDYEARLQWERVADTRRQTAVTFSLFSSDPGTDGSMGRYFGAVQIVLFCFVERPRATAGAPGTPNSLTPMLPNLGYRRMSICSTSSAASNNTLMHTLHAANTVMLVLSFAYQ